MAFYFLGLYFLLQGMQDAVTLPTLNLYLLSYGAQPSFIGIVMAAGTFATLASAPIFGLVSDKLQSLKVVLIVGIVIQIAGGMLYFAANSPIMIFAGNFFTGLGEGSLSSVMGAVARSSDEDDQAAAFSQVLLLYQLGLVVGSLSNTLLAKLNFALGPFTVDAYTSPGLLIALMWTICLLLVVLCSRQLPRSQPQTSAESQPLSVRMIGRVLIREEVVVTLWSSFVAMFLQSCFNTWFAPFTKTYYNWGDLPNALLFGGVNVMTMIGYFAVSRLSRKVSDPRIFLVGTGGLSVVYAILFACLLLMQLEDSQKSSLWSKVVFSLCSLVIAFFTALVIATQTSIYSKAVNKDHMDFFQGFNMLVAGAGGMIGPLWAAGLLSHLPTVTAVNFAFVTLSLVTIATSYEMLRITYSKEDAESETEREQSDEATPLLA